MDSSNFPVDADQLVYLETPEGGESGFNGWSAFSDDGKTWFMTTNTDPSQPWDFLGGGGEGLDLTQTFFDQTGLNDLNIAEATIGILEGYVTWMVSTNDGQIIWWPHIPDGPFVSIPNPYTAVVNSVGNLNPLEINISGDEVPEDNEKIIIEGSTGLVIDGAYFVESLGSNNYRLYLDSALMNPMNASSLTGTYDAGSADAKLSSGTYIDALGYGDGKFFAGNDDEEVFVCSSFTNEGGNLIWTKVDDRNNSFLFWNDVDYGDFEGNTNVVPVTSNSCVRKLLCNKGIDANGDKIFTCATWRKFSANCPKVNFQCNPLSEAWVAAITVCNQRLF